MQSIEGILLEPVGCLAEFPPEPFDKIAARSADFQSKPGRSGSAAYWHLLALVSQGTAPQLAGALEIQTVNAAVVYEDVRPALAELKAMGIRLSIASSLSGAAIFRFLELHSLSEVVSGVSSRDHAGGIMAVPLAHALRSGSLVPDRTIYLTDSAEGIKAAKTAGVHPILIMNDPDEARRLAVYEPAGGIVSLHELPDFIRLIAAQNNGREDISDHYPEG